jgi:hypothetical protein
VKDNPARRLKSILLETSRYSSVEPTQRIWGRFFNLDEQDTVEINRRLLMLVDLFREVKETVERIDPPGITVNLRDLEGFERRILPSNLSQKWTTLSIPQINRALEFCEKVIERNTSYEELDEDKHSEFYSDIDDLVSKINTSNARHELKGHISEILDDIKRAILEYQRWGNKGLQQPLLTLVGTVIINRNDLSRDAPGFCSRFLSVLTNIVTILMPAGYVDKLPTLIDSLRPLLLGR